MKQIQIVKLGINGEGIGYDHKYPVFVDGALPGEEVLVEITQKTPTYSKGVVKKRLTTSPFRRKPVCPYHAQCGGCGLQHLDYQQQSTLKKQLLEEALWKYGHVKKDLVRKMHDSDQELGYRNQCKLPFGESQGKLFNGFYQKGTNHFMPIETCLAHSEELETLRKQVLNILNSFQLKPYNHSQKSGLRYLVLRVIQGKGQLLLVTGKDILPEACLDSLMELDALQSIHQSKNTHKKILSPYDVPSQKLRGEDTITIQVSNLSIQLSPESFFQLNLPQAQRLYELAVAKIDSCHTLVEAYCGVGVMSLLAKEKADIIYGIESVPQAITNAKKNIALNGLKHPFRFRCEDAAVGLQQIAKTETVNTVLVDPPRSGLNDAFLHAIEQTLPKRIVYVSCNPATLAKNLKVLKHHYQVLTVIPFDLFPNTPHVETIVVLSR